MMVKVDNVELAGIGATGTNDLTINGERIADPKAFFRADSIEVFNRGNQSTEIAFSVAREFADIADAHVYLLEHYTSIPGRGLVTLTAKGTKKSIERYLKDAMVQKTTGKPFGKTIIFSYRILGGIILTAKT